MVETFYKRKGEDIYHSLTLVDVQENKMALYAENELKTITPDEYLEKLTWIKSDGCISDLIVYLKKELPKNPTYNNF